MMARRATLLALPVLVLLAAAVPASAQDVRADVRIRTGPVDGRVVIGDDGRYDPRERDRVIVVERDRRDSDRSVIVARRGARRVTIVEDFRGKSQRAHARHDDRHIVAYWDPRRDEYGFQRWRSGLRPVLLCEHGNKLYVLDRNYLVRDRDWRYERDGWYGRDDDWGDRDDDWGDRNDRRQGGNGRGRRN